MDFYGFIAGRVGLLHEPSATAGDVDIPLAHGNEPDTQEPILARKKAGGFGVECDEVNVGPEAFAVDAPRVSRR